MDFPGRLDHTVKGDAWPRIEVKDKAAGNFGQTGPAVRGMDLDATHLGHSDQGFGPVDGQIGVRVTGHLDRVEQGRRGLAQMSLKKSLTVQPLRDTDD